MVSPAPVMFFASPFSERLPHPTQNKTKASAISVFVTLDCHTNSMYVRCARVFMGRAPSRGSLLAIGRSSSSVFIQLPVALYVESILIIVQ